MQDVDAPDDNDAPTVPEALAQHAEQQAYAAAEPVRLATLQRLQDLKSRLEQVRQLYASTEYRTAKKSIGLLIPISLVTLAL